LWCRNDFSIVLHLLRFLLSICEEVLLVHLVLAILALLCRADAEALEWFVVSGVLDHN